MELKNNIMAENSERIITSNFEDGRYTDDVRACCHELHLNVSVRNVKSAIKEMLHIEELIVYLLCMI